MTSAATYRALGLELEKLAYIGEYARDFAAGMDPLGVWTGQYAAEAEREGADRRRHLAKGTASTLGGAVGGAVLLPSAITGLMGAVKGYSKGGLGGAGKGFVEGAKGPGESLLNALRARSYLGRAAKAQSGRLKASPEEYGAIKSLVGDISLKDVLGIGRKAGEESGKSGINPLSFASAVPGMLRGNLSLTPEQARMAQSGIKTPFRSVMSGLGLAAGVGGLSAGAQYAKGMSDEKAYKQREQEAVQKAQGGPAPAVAPAAAQPQHQPVPAPAAAPGMSFRMAPALKLASVAKSLAGMAEHLPTLHAEHLTDLAGLGMMAAGSASHLGSQLKGHGDEGGVVGPTGQAGLDLAGLATMAAPTAAAMTSLAKGHKPAHLAGGGSKFTNIANLAGLGALAIPTIDKIQARIRAGKAGVSPEEKMLLGEGAHKALELGGYGALAAPILRQGRGMGLGGATQLAGYATLAAPHVVPIEGPARSSSEIAGLGLLAAPTIAHLLHR